MKKTRQRITEQKLKEAILEEYFNVMLEDVSRGVMEADDFASNLNQAAQGIPKVFNAIMTNLAKRINSYVNDDLLPRAQGQKIKNAIEQVSDPEEFKDEKPEEKAASMEDLNKIIDAAINATKQAGGTEQAKELEKIGDKADELEKAVEKTGPQSDEEIRREIGEVDPKVKQAVLDLIDATNEKWDSIMKATKNKKLKAAMDTMEKVALMERLFKEILTNLRGKKMMCENDLCTLLEEAIKMLEDARKDADKCQHKCNKSAGVRLRKTCQDVRAKLGDVRSAVQELKDRPRSECKEG